MPALYLNPDLRSNIHATRESEKEKIKKVGRHNHDEMPTIRATKTRETTTPSSCAAQTHHPVPVDRIPLPSNCDDDSSDQRSRREYMSKTRVQTSSAAASE